MEIGWGGPGSPGLAWDAIWGVLWWMIREDWGVSLKNWILGKAGEMCCYLNTLKCNDAGSTREETKVRMHHCHRVLILSPRHLV